MRIMKFLRVFCGMALFGLIGLSKAGYAACSGATPSNTQYRLTETNQRMTYFASEPERTLIGIDTFVIDGFVMRVRVGALSQYVEYEAPQLKRIQVTRHEARPATALIANTILVGLPLLIAPKRQLEILVGCTDEKLSDVVPDKSQQQPTGNKEWRSEGKKQHMFHIVVEGLANPVIIKSLASDQETLDIDLKDAVMATSTFPVDLKVVCTTCQNLDNPAEEPFGLSELKGLSADFSKPREIELAEQRRIQEEEMRRLARLKAAEAKALTELRLREAKEREVRERQLEQQRAIREKSAREAKERQRKSDAAQQLSNL